MSDRTISRVRAIALTGGTLAGAAGSTGASVRSDRTAGMTRLESFPYTAPA